ncbi:hypothetical protein O9H85_22540 [Paenibacillus filicis]|uniref:Type II secretion system protein GspF domain-containing protein n=1 Tax=Paenibacillus gyeongsangnamensis TaxID=3388067 RepID=A0ABT4QE67_9BACL|nr:hypothetical protein [Paenibacillus filicis]MCZ8515146.1 hypothetical protein [Paenibacillus filicis]
MIRLYPVVLPAVLLMSALLFSAGAFTLFRPLLLRLSLEHAAERRHRRRMKELNRKEQAAKGIDQLNKLTGRMFRELELMLKTIQGARYRPGAVERWLTGAISSGLSAGLLGFFSSGDLRFSVFLGVLVPGVLLTFLRLRLRSIQLQSGYDLAQAVGILAGKYKMSRGNMRTALRLAGPEIASPAIRRMFLHLIREELNYVDPREMEKAIEELVYGIQTSFAKQLGLTLLKGLLGGEHVERTLMTIDKNIHKQMDLLRDEGDSSSEVLQLSWLHVLLFPLLIVLMIVFMGVNSTLHYQLGTDSGRFWLTAAIGFILVSLLMALWFRKPPNDY